MIGKLIAAFAATTAQLLGASDTAAIILFGSEADGDYGVFSIDDAGKVTANGGSGRTKWKATLNAGGMVTGAGILMGRVLLNGEQVGDTVTATIPVGSTIPFEIKHDFDSLSEGDEVQFQFILDAAGSATDGGTVLIDGTSNAAGWSSMAPAKLEIFG